MKKLAKLEVDTLRRINRLCDLGARPPVIEALLPTVTDSLIRSQWQAIQQKTPPKGRLPILIDWYFSNYQVKLQSSFIAAIFKRTNVADVHYVDGYITSYERYLEVFESPALSFDRAWYLIRALNADLITTVTCRECGSEYIHNPHSQIDHRTCPCCRVYGLNKNPRKRADVQAAPILNLKPRQQPLFSNVRTTEKHVLT